MNKPEQVEELVKYMVNTMSIPQLVEYVIDSLNQYYMNPKYQTDFIEAHQSMLQVKEKGAHTNYFWTENLTLGVPPE